MEHRKDKQQPLSGSEWAARKGPKAVVRHRIREHEQWKGTSVPRNGVHPGHFSGLMVKHKGGGPDNGSRGRLGRLHLFLQKGVERGARQRFESRSLERLCHRSIRLGGWMPGTLTRESRCGTLGAAVRGEHDSAAFTFGNQPWVAPGSQVWRIVCGEANKILKCLPWQCVA